MRIAARIGTAILLLVLCGSGAWADVIVLDFNDADFAVPTAPPVDSTHPLVNDPSYSNHGRIVTSTTGFNQTTGLPGTMPVGISAVGPGPDIAVIFDTRLNYTGTEDLEDPFGAASAEGSAGFLPYPITPGNGVYSSGIRPGHVLIRNSFSSTCSGGVCPNPDDDNDGSVFNFNFDSAVFTTGVDLISLDVFDVDDGWVNESVTLSIYDMEDDQIGDDVVILGSQVGDGNAARLDLAYFFAGNAGVGRLQVAISGSGAISNLAFDPPPPNGAQVPEPASMALFTVGLIGLGAVHRRRRKAPASA